MNSGSSGEWSEEIDTMSPAAEPEIMIPRRYQLEFLEQAKKENTIVYLETGCGKTHVAVMLLQHFSHLIRKPNKGIAVFLCPTVFLVHQQAKVVGKYSDLKVGSYTGDMNVDAWKLQTWEQEMEKCEVFVMTPQIMLQNLHHCFMRMDCIEVLIFDECHHTGGRHPYACIMREFYHTRTQDTSYKLPRILGMTASPINGKVDRDGHNIDRELDKIESLLHAKLYIVKERSELDSVVHRPHEKIEYYESPYGTHNTTQLFVITLLELKNEYIGKLLDASNNKVGAKVDKKMVKHIEKLHNSLSYCASELGLKCVQEALKISVAKHANNGEIKSNLKTEGKMDFLRTARSSLELLLSEEKRLSSDALLDEGSGSLHLSSKVHTLISILQRYRNDLKDMRCIIFVERKITTRVLASLLGDIDFLSQLRFKPLAGKSAGLNETNRKNQQLIVDSFRNGEVNVLVSTNVAEEGLDIQSCHLVIRFDLPKTPCSLIQSRGRARCLNSTYIYLVEKHNNSQVELLQQFKMNEESMKGKASSRIAPVEDLEALEPTLLEPFQVESTGASINTDCSIPLLYRYCEVLAHDSFRTSTLSFDYSNGGSGDVKCEVFFTTGEVLQRVEGRAASSRSDAKRIACLDACKRLYECGMLTDLLLPKIQEDGHPLVNVVRENNHVPEKLPSQVHSTIVPQAFSGTWAMAESGVTLYAYTVSFVPTPNDRAYVNFGLFLESDLGPEAGIMEVELHLRNRRLVNTKCLPSGRLDFEQHQLQDAKMFQERLISSVLDRKLGHNITGEWNSNRLYLLLPLKENLRATSHLSIDWECISKVISDVEYKPQKNISQDDECGDHHHLVKIRDGDVPVNFVLDSVVQTVHNGFIYFARELIHDLTANSPMVTKPKDTYVEFFKQKHETTLQHLQQPMLKAKPFIQVHSLLTVHNNSERPAADELKAEQLVELPLELCEIMVRGISCGLANGASLLPSFMHRLEGLLLAIQLRETLSQSYPEASQVSANLMLEAITTSKCQESFSLEGLELLGDAFLEVAVSEHLFLVNNNFQEGKLSQLRTSIICNSALEKLGKERGIMKYIRDIQFCPNDWAAPGRDVEHGKENFHVHPINRMKKTTRQESVLQGKTIADVVEALIGAHYDQGGENAAQSMMRWFGREVGVDPQKRHEARTRKNGQQGLLPASKIVQIENLLTYKFENKDLLVEALTHASYGPSSRDSYQRLEFLGDAVLDFLITKHFYKHLAPLKRDPGLLTDLRSAAVNNECFARVAVRHNLHKYLLHNSPDLAKSINHYVKFVQDSTSDTQSSCHGWAGDDGPKVLSDLVESLAGAVFVDSNFDLDTVWRVFKQILRPLVTPETLRLEPTRELRELCQSLKFNDPEFKKTHGAKGDFEITVTVYMNDTQFTEVARKADNKSAKKAAAIQALAKLKTLGKEHFKSRLLKREALSTKSFSPLVDVPEGEESTNTNADTNTTKVDCCNDLGVIGHSSTTTNSKTGSNNVEPAQISQGRKAECVNEIMSFISYSGCGTDVMHQSRESVCSRDESLNQVDSGDDIFHDALSNNLTEEHCEIIAPPDVMDTASSALWETGLNYQGLDSTVQNPNHREASATFKSQKNTTFPDIATIPLSEHDYVPQRDQEHPNLVDTLHSGGKIPAYHSEVYSIVDYLRRSKIGDFQNDPTSNITPKSANSTHLEGISSYLFSGDAATDCSDSLCHQSSHFVQPAAPPPTEEPGPRRQLAKGEARSKLNELCVKQRWKDPEYKRVSIEGVSHAPVYKYMVMTTFSMDGKEYEIEVEGEPTKDIKGAKDSAAMQALVWFEDYGFVCH